MVLDDLENLPAPAPAPLGAAMEAELASLAPVAMRRPWRQFAILVAVSLVYGTGMLFATHVRRDLGDLPRTWIVGAAIAWSIGFLVPAFVAIVPAPGSVSPRIRAGVIVAAFCAIAFVTFGLMWPIPSGPHSDHYEWERFLRGHWCLEIGLATAIAPVIAGTMFLRGALPVGARWTAAALGAAGGCLGGLVLHLHCFVTDNLHVGIVHGGVVVVAALLAVALVPRRV